MGIDGSLTVCTEAYNPKGVIQDITLLYPPPEKLTCAVASFISVLLKAHYSSYPS